MYEAMLKEKMGKTYDVGGIIFKEGVKKPVTDSLADYLKGNPNFSVEEISNKKFTSEELKKKNVADLESIIFKLGGDVKSVSNQEQRVELILTLQEEGE